MTLIQRDFSSWYDFVTCVSDESLFANADKNHESHKKSYNNWYGTYSFDDAINMALNLGWPEGRKLLIDSLAIVSPKPEPYKSIAYDVAGAFPMIPLYLTGEPAHMMNFPEQDSIANNPVVRIDYCNGGLSEVLPESLMLRGAAVLSLANTLEQKGYSTEIRLVVDTRFYFSFQAFQEPTIFKTTIIIKKAGEPLDLDRLAFSLAHPSVHRRLRFALIEQHKEFKDKKGSTFQFTPDYIPPNVIHITGPNPNETPQSARLAIEIAAKSYLQERN